MWYQLVLQQSPSAASLSFRRCWGSTIEIRDLRIGRIRLFVEGGAKVLDRWWYGFKLKLLPEVPTKVFEQLVERIREIHCEADGELLGKTHLLGCTEKLDVSQCRLEFCRRGRTEWAIARPFELPIRVN